MEKLGCFIDNLQNSSSFYDSKEGLITIPPSPSGKEH